MTARGAISTRGGLRASLMNRLETMIDDVSELSYFQEAGQLHGPEKLLIGIMHYYYIHGAPLGEKGVGIWLFFDQRTMRN